MGWLGAPLFVLLMGTGLLMALFPLAAACVLFAAFRARRAASRGRRVAWWAAAAYFSFAASAGFENWRWCLWHYDGNGLKGGMTVEEAERTLKSRSPKLEKVYFDLTRQNAYQVFPPGLAGVLEQWGKVLPELYYVEVTFGADGRLVRSYSRSD